MHSSEIVRMAGTRLREVVGTDELIACGPQHACDRVQQAPNALERQPTCIGGKVVFEVLS